MQSAFFFPRRTDKKNILLSIYLLSYSYVNMCHLLAVIWKEFLIKVHETDSMMFMFLTMSVHAYIQYNWSIKILSFNYKKQCMN